MIIVGVILFIVLLAGYMFLKKKVLKPVVESVLSTPEKISEITADAEKSSEEIKKDLGDAIGEKSKKLEDAGIVSADEMKKGLAEETKKVLDKELTCAIKPSIHMGCGKNFVLDPKSGCCALKAGKNPGATAMKIKLAKSIGTEILVGALAGALIEKLIMKSPAIGRMGARLAAKLLQRVAPRIAVKMSSKLAVYGAMGGAGPAGWAVGAAMLAFDAISMTLDMLDVDGYNSYTSNDVIEDMRKLMDYSLWKSLQDAGMDYPMLFPLAEPFKNEFEAAQSFMGGEMFNKFVMKDINETPSMKVLWDGFLEKALVDETAELPEAIVTFTGKTIEKYHKERDLIMFTKMQELLGKEKGKIELYEFMSTPKRIGISLSEAGAEEWNTKQREVWFKNNDLFKPPTTPPTFINPTAALYTDTYFVLDVANPGTKEKPNMISKKLPKKTVLGCAYGTVITYCEKRRQMKGISDAVDPRKLGVKFDMQSGSCQFTKKFCIRYGMVYKNNNCKLAKGQKIAEMILGPSVTRASIREWDDRKAALKSGNPVKIAGALTKMYLDPTGLGTPAVKRLIKEIGETKAKKTKPAKKIPCPPGMRDDGTSCWKDTKAKKSRPAKKKRCPPGMRDDGTSCWKDTKARKSRPAKKKRCPPGMRDDRTSCWKDTKARKSRPAKKKRCPSGMRDDRTSCWKDAYGRGAGKVLSSRGGKCTGGGCRGGGCKRWGKCRKVRCSKVRCSKIKYYCKSKYPEKQSSLCYKRCKPGYRGVGPMCHPKNGAGIKVTLMKRQYCDRGQHKVAGICWDRCPNGFKNAGALCHPRGGPGIKVTLMKRQYCARGQHKVAGICWDRCPSGFKNAGALCHPRGGPGIKVTLMKRQYCAPGSKNVAGICWPKCSPGYKDIGALCEPKGGPGIKKTLFKRQKCPAGWKNVAGVCWSKCPPGYRDDGALCNKN